MVTIIVALPILIWIYLLFFRGMFWREASRDLSPGGNLVADWPAVTAIVPARNEADVIAKSLQSLLSQDYPGPLSIIVVNDRSEDATGDIVQQMIGKNLPSKDVTMLEGSERPEGWVGKMWALKQGWGAAQKHTHTSYYLFTDADIHHEPQVLRQLVALAEEKKLVMVSLMAKLSVVNWIERALVPAYIYFFMKLYPFAWIRNPRQSTGGAAGGCMLVKKEDFEKAGGIDTIQGAIIDDCALGIMMKKQGAVWLSLAEHTTSLRPYRSWVEIWELIARSAFTQLHYSSILLSVAILGMFFTYLLPLILLASNTPLVKIAGILSYGMMVVSYLPILRYYRISPLWALALPLIALFFMGATLHSAIRYWRGIGIKWKGRLQTAR